jgi:hypothetical protein
MTAIIPPRQADSCGIFYVHFSRIAWMEHGRIVQLGPAEEMVEAYRNSVAASPPAPGALVA